MEIMPLLGILAALAAQVVLAKVVLFSTPVQSPR
jgi:hypothetical protein